MEELMNGILAPRASGIVLSSTPPIPNAEPSDANGPAWMKDPPKVSQTTVRTGAAPMRGSGMSTVLFFALIVLVVGAAGTAGVLLWGPDKVSTNRTHLATDPPPAEPLPSLSAQTPAADPSAAPSADVAQATPADGAAAMKKGVKRRTKKGH
jgi:hypothetical protein